MEQKRPKVYIESLSSGYPKTISSGFEWVGLANEIRSSDTVFIKPNMTYPYYLPGVMTNPEAIEATIQSLKNFTQKIIIGDADSGGYHRFSMDEVYCRTGLIDIARKNDVKIVNLSKCSLKSHKFKYKKTNFILNLPRLLTDDIDILITMPVPKVHVNTTVSLTFKNQWGCIPSPSDRLRLHPFLNHVLLELNKAVKAKAAIIDGKYGLNNSGPMIGTAVQLDWLLVTNDIGAGARVACELMKVPLCNVSHLSYLAAKGMISPIDEIAINQNLKKFYRCKFILRRKWTDYPGLLAFNSPLLAHIAYFSPLSNILHRLLYLFRKPFYDYGKNPSPY